jgi:hypothetical protein
VPDGGESLEAVSPDLGVPVAGLSDWRDQALAAAESSLKAQPRRHRYDEIARLKNKLGDATMDNELHQEKVQRLEPQQSPSRGGVKMIGGIVSPSADRCYGLVRVSRVRQVAQSTICHQRYLPPDHHGHRPPTGQRRERREAGRGDPRGDRARTVLLRGMNWHGITAPIAATSC